MVVCFVITTFCSGQILDLHEKAVHWQGNAIKPFLRWNLK
jgi:hypothetical protein